MFETLPYNSKIEICKLFYCDKFKCATTKKYFKVYFNWRWVEFESSYGDIRTTRKEVGEWYSSNLNIIRRSKLISITKRETIAPN